MFAPIHCLFADASSGLPSPDTTRVMVSVNATVAPQSSTYEPGASTSSGTLAGGSANLTVYPWKPLLDDESPRSLQSFLQRTSFVAIDAGGNYIWSAYSPSAGGGRYTQDEAQGAASVRWFVWPALAVLGAVGGTYLHDEQAPAASFPTTRTIEEPWGSVGVDLRSGDASLSLQWQALMVDEIGSGRLKRAPGFFGARFTLAGRIVIGRRYDLTASAELIPDGAEGSAGLAWYPSKDFGLSLSGQIEHGQIYWDTTTDYDAVLGGPTLSYWVGRRVELWVSYAPEWVSWAQGTQWEQDVTVGMTERIPGE